MAAGELTGVLFAKSNMTLLDRVKKLYKDNRRVGKIDGIYYDYTCPSPKNYPHQWIWDSCFHAIVLTHFDLERAKREIRTLLRGQKENGFIPCVKIWKRRYLLEDLFYTSKISQPPVIPLAVEIIFEKSKDRKFLTEAYPKSKAFMNWFALNRDSNHNGLIEVVHPWETGIDSTPTFDGQLGIKSPHPGFTEVMFKFLTLNQKVFRSENVLMNSIYAKSLKSMSRMARTIGKGKDTVSFEKRYEEALNALITRCWSSEDEIFYDLDQKGRQVKVKTVSSLMPLILDGLPKKYVGPLVNHLTNKKEFRSEYPIPSVSMDEKTFDPNGGLVLWRGPSWINTNWFISRALLEKGYKKESGIINKKTLQMVEKSGLWEFYNPLNGVGYGQPTFGWSTLVLDMTQTVKDS